MDKTILLAARRRVADVEAQIGRCDTAINQMVAADERLGALRKERMDALASSFLAQTPADTADCDARIGAAEKEAARLREDAAGASAARETLIGQLEEARKGVGTAQDVIRTQRVGRLGAMYSEVCGEYDAALAALLMSLDRMDAIAHLVNRCRPEARTLHSGAYYLRNALSDGLVRSDRSPVNPVRRTVDPKIAEEIAASLGFDDD